LPGTRYHGVESHYIEIDVAIKLAPNDIYKAFGNTVNASYVLENGTVILNKELQKRSELDPAGRARENVHSVRRI